VTIGQRHLASISGCLALFLSFLTLGFGIAAFVDKQNVYQYLENHKSDIGDDKVETIETWYFTLGICLFLVSGLQFTRSCLSSRYVRSADRLDDAYIILVDEDEEEAKAEERADATASRYDNMRSQYAQKYAKMENESTVQWKQASSTNKNSSTRSNNNNTVANIGKSSSSSSSKNVLKSSSNPFFDE